jgi:hypothetical protein
MDRSMNARIAWLALTCGVCALVPLPFLDAWLERRVTRALFRAVAVEAGQPLDEATLALLTEDRESLLLGCLGTVLIWPLKKLFRTVFYFLTLKDVVDGVALAAVRASMVHARIAHLPAEAGRVRDHMDATIGRWRYSPVSRLFLRGPRPEAAWLVPGGPGRVVGWLYQKGGGGAILADFQAKIEENVA